MSQQQENLNRLKAAYSTWNDSKGGSTSVWEELMADTVRLVSVEEGTSGLDFARKRSSRQGVLEYLSGILNNWDMVHVTPETYVAEGDNIAMFGRAAWRNKQTAKVADCRVAVLGKFQGDKAVEFTDLFDSAVAAKAAMPD